MRVKISCDDGAKEDMRVAELVRKHELDCLFYIPVMWRLINADKKRTYLSEDEFKHLADHFVIGSHTISHPLLTRIPIESARDEIINSRKIMQDLTGQPIKSLAWPRGYTNPNLQAIARDAGYEDARGVGVGYFYESENQYDTKTTLHAGYDRKEYGGASWFQYGMYMLAEAVKIPDSEYHIFLHSWELANYPNGFELFDVLLGEIRKQTLRITHV
jgi:peptidoglycan/xylan/chitin deacetylase (PgdA/CDA1 family)